MANVIYRYLASKLYDIVLYHQTTYFVGLFIMYMFSDQMWIILLAVEWNVDSIVKLTAVDYCLGIA